MSGQNALRQRQRVADPPAQNAAPAPAKGSSAVMMLVLAIGCIVVCLVYDFFVPRLCVYITPMVPLL
jgi:hypothetical protein